MKNVWTKRLMTVWMAGMCVCGAARGQSFDCGTAKTEVEKAVCSDAELALLDDKLAAAYRRVMNGLPAESAALVRANEESWLQATESGCTNKPAFNENFVTCVKRRYRDRTAALEGMLVERGGMKFVVLSKTLLARDARLEPGVTPIEENPGFGTLHVSWVEALSDAPEWKAWNAAVLAETRRLAGGSGDPAEGWRNEWAAGTESEVKESVEQVSPVMVTVAMVEDGMGHEAAHPTQTNEEFHWLLKEERLLRVDDVLKAGSAWEKVFVKQCRASMKEQYGRDYDQYSGGDFGKALDGVIEEPKNWKIDAEGITVNFPDESVTPHADPVNPVTVTWKELKGMVVEGFAVPKS